MTAEPTTASTGAGHRRVAALVLVILASILAFVALFAIWIDRQILNTDNWTRASSQMLERPVIREQLAGYLTDQIYGNVDVAGQLRSVLPGPAKALADPAATALRGQVQNLTESALSRPRVQGLWENANRTAQLQLLSILHGGGRVVSTTNGEVVLDLRALLQETEQRVGVGGRLAGLLPAGAARIVVLKSDQLSTAQNVAKLLENLPVIAVVLSLALFGGALLVAPRWRRNALRAYGIGLVVAGGAALLAKSWAGDQIVSSLATTAAMEPAVREVWDIYTPLLDAVATATIGYGAFMVLSAWLAGPTRSATALRRVSAPYLREPGIAYFALALFVAVVILWWAPTPATRNPVTGIALVALLALGFEALRRRTALEFPDAERTPVIASVRSRLGQTGGAVAGGVRRQGDAVVKRASSFAAARTPSAGPAEAEPADARLERLERLESLHASGAIDDGEFRAEKARILGNGAGHPAPR